MIKKGDCIFLLVFALCQVSVSVFLSFCQLNYGSSKYQLCFKVLFSAILREQKLWKPLTDITIKVKSLAWPTVITSDDWWFWCFAQQSPTAVALICDSQCAS